MAFIKRKRGFSSAVASEEKTEIVRKIVQEEKDGTIVQNVVFDEVPLGDIADALPSADVYTLENLMKAGVDLKTLPVGHLLDDTDLTNIDALRESISEELYYKLLDIDAAEKAQAAAPIVEPETKE